MPALQMPRRSRSSGGIRHQAGETKPREQPAFLVLLASLASPAPLPQSAAELAGAVAGMYYPTSPAMARELGSIVFVGFMSFTIAYYAAHVVWYFIR